MSSQLSEWGVLMSRDLMVHHYGPDPAYVGGMGSVIRVLTEQQVGGDVVMAHPTWRPDSRFASFPLALRAAWGLARLRRSDVVHVHLAEEGSFLREGALVALARLLGKGTVVTIHGADFLPFAQKYTRLTAGVLRRAHIITCLDQDVVDLVRQIAPRARVELLPNPVAQDNTSKGAGETEEIVLFAGEIGLRKGADVLSRAWQQVIEARRQARCIMVGPVNDFAVPDAERLDVRAPVGAQAMKELLHSARVVVLPSRAEGMPMILTEAMSAGRPFVSTPVGGIPELAQQGGVLVPVEDDVELARRLVDLLENPALAQELGEQGRRFCTETRSTEVVGIRLRELYQAASATAHRHDR
jgi:glycosyltransferase involved in cell wall biosynthesis